MFVAVHYLILKTDGQISLLSVIKIWKVYNVYTIPISIIAYCIQIITHSVSTNYQWVLRFNGYALMREFRNSTIYHYLGLIYKLNFRLPAVVKSVLNKQWCCQEF